jgi:hypothetical protein
MGALREVLHLAIGHLDSAGDARRGEGSGDAGVQRHLSAHPPPAGRQKRVEDRQVRGSVGVEVERPGPVDRRPPGQREARRIGGQPAVDACRFTGQVGGRGQVCRGQGAARAGAQVNACRLDLHRPGRARGGAGQLRVRPQRAVCREVGGEDAGEIRGDIAQCDRQVERGRRTPFHFQHRLPQAQAQPVHSDAFAETDAHRREQAQRLTLPPRLQCGDGDIPGPGIEDGGAGQPRLFARRILRRGRQA